LKSRIRTWTGRLKDLRLTPLEYVCRYSILNNNFFRPGTEVPQLEQYSEEAIEEFDLDKLERELAFVSEKTAKAKPNLAVLDEYRERYTEYTSRMADLDDATKNRDRLKQAYDDLRKRRLDEFMKGFSVISQKLKEMYQVIIIISLV
jgi:structural maintenance of chromosome 4